jgi:quercetin dioxygenase-like cupin family protein
MENQSLKRYVHFSPDGVRRETVYETEHLFTQVLCFERNQTLGPMSDPASDALFLVMAGEAVFLVEGKRKRVEQWASVLVPAGEEVHVTNASVDPLVLLMTTAPPPVPRAVTG